MSAEVSVKETAAGWDVHITEAEDVVVRTVGKRIVVAIVPDDDDTPTPLEVTLAETS